MARQGVRKTVRCYNCHCRFEVSARAMSTSCPGCHKAVVVEDIVITGLKTTQKLQTCGRVVVKSRGRIMAGKIEAHSGLEVHGALLGDVTSGGPVVIGSKARWKGDCKAPTLEVHMGARIESGFFEVPYEPDRD